MNSPHKSPQLPLADRIAAWRQAFEGDDNAIVNTLVSYAWNFAVFQTVAKAVELAPEDGHGNKRLNGMMLQLLRTTYWGSAVMAIRRLVDNGKLHGKFGVASLRSILNDVRSSRDELTRRVYVEDIAKLPYDWEVLDALWWDRHFGGVPQAPDEATRRAQDPEPSRQRHEEFDFLSGVAPANRTPDDLIDPTIFDRLEARLGRLDTIADHATIHFAHAGTEFSRQGRDMGQWGPTEAVDALRELVEVAELIGRWFVFTSVHDVLPTPQFNQFEHLDQPLMANDDTSALDAAWEAFAEQTARWHSLDNVAL